MEKKDLKSAGVTFYPEPHVYVRDVDGKELQGITTMISRCLFPDEYAFVDSATLSAKAAYGTRRHKQIQDMIVFGDEPETDAQIKFAAMMSEAGLRPIASEYTVTDGSEFASNIDVVCADASLIDIKTTATLNRAKVSWQLSLYAMMFEHVNPGLSAGRLFAAWIPKVGRPRLVEVPRRSTADLLGLMEAWVEGVPYKGQSHLDPALVARLLETKETMAALKEELDTIQEQVIAALKANGETGYKDEFLSISFKPASTSSRFDAAAFKAADPEAYKKYVTKSEVKESLTVKLRS